MARTPAQMLSASLAARIPALLVFAAAGASAQTAVAPTTAAPGADGPARLLSITPSLSLNETVTDNAQLAAGDAKKGDYITTVSPGLHFRSSSGRVTGFFDYELSAINYARGTSANELQNSLNAALTAEAIDNFAYLDMKAGISQQTLSAFGTQSFDPTLGNSNRTEVATYSISPYVRGHLGSLADYEIRLVRLANRSDDTAAGFDSTTSTGSVSLKGITGLALLGWTFDASRSIVSYGEAGETQDTQAQAGLSYAVSPELKLSITGGYERDNYTGPEFQSGATYGGGFEWHPTVRTTFSGDIEHRPFGNSHDLKFEHRTQRTVWIISDSRNIMTGNNQPLLGSLGTAYNLFYQQFASIQPDPVLRQQLVDSYLQSHGIDPNATIFEQFLSNSVTLEHDQLVSFALVGVRDTLTFAAMRTESNQLQNTSGGSDSFNQATDIRQVGFSVDLAHRLTPDTSLNVTLQQARTTGSGTGSGTSDGLSLTVRSAMINWQTRIGRRTYVALGARHAEAAGTAPYYETAVVGSLRVQF